MTAKREYKHIVFDIDGTLIDTEEAILQSLKDTVRDMLHKEIGKQELKFALGIPGSAALRKLGITDTEGAKDRWNGHLLKYKSRIRLFGGIPQLLESLKMNGCRLGIVTSKTRNEYTTDFAAPFALSGYFGTVICEEDAPRPKPYPDPLLTYLDTARIKAGDALYIGDTLYDCQCAQNAGLDFGLAAWGNAAVQGVPADYIFRRPVDVLLSLSGNSGSVSKNDIYDLLHSYNISYEVTEHKAVYNMAELTDVSFPYPESVAKNLFVCDDRKRNYYLITVKGDKRVDLKAFRRTYGTRPLGLAKEEDLKTVLGLTPGAVTPLGLLNDKGHKTQFFLDEDFLSPPSIIGVHPNENTATVWLKTEDLLRIITAHTGPVKIVPFH